MHFHVLREANKEERRVSATPDTVAKLIGLGAAVSVEPGAGEGSLISDQAYATTGATVVPRDDALSQADVLLCVGPPEPASLQGAQAGTILIGNLEPFGKTGNVEEYARFKLTALAMELMPRITRAQSMDTLSSQSNLAGYRAIIDAAAEYGRAFPMMMTAAGTITAARVFIMGAGVAGLQAIATARRLGAQVSATDVRSATMEQISSLGAKPIFVEADDGGAGEGTGGYAGETSEAYRRAQADLVTRHIARQDIVVTTALIPGRPAPRLIDRRQVASMRPGSVIVDLAVEHGGNVEGSIAGEVVEQDGVRIVGHRNVASRLPSDASALFARNLLNFITAFWNREEKRLVLANEDEIVRSTLLTSQGQVVHPRLLAVA